ncbi:MAG: hypothetical protein WKF30_13025 [Pyrinomonadaceae bacterium]
MLVREGASAPAWIIVELTNGVIRRLHRCASSTSPSTSPASPVSIETITRFRDHPQIISKSDKFADTAFT